MPVAKGSSSRLPGSASSLRVQTTALGPQATDTQLLAASVQSQQRRRREILSQQEALIENNVDTERLKRALTHLSPASWVQVLHERHLGGTCGYPTCSAKPRLAEISRRGTALPSGATRYRISLSGGTISRDTADDPGGRNAFCGDECWKRAEWVRRWVLSDELRGKGKGREEDQETGRFEQRWTEDQWQQVELLEDLEDGDASASSSKAPAVAAPAEESKRAVENAVDVQGAAALVESLVIRERPVQRNRSPPAKQGQRQSDGTKISFNYVPDPPASSLLREITHSSSKDKGKGPATGSSSRRRRPVDPTQMERDEIARLMEQALGVRDHQRHLGKLPEEEDLSAIRAEHAARKAVT